MRLCSGGLVWVVIYESSFSWSVVRNVPRAGIARKEISGESAIRKDSFCRLRENKGADTLPCIPHSLLLPLSGPLPAAGLL